MNSQWIDIGAFIGQTFNDQLMDIPASEHHQFAVVIADSGIQQSFICETASSLSNAKLAVSLANCINSYSNQDENNQLVKIGILDENGHINAQEHNSDNRIWAKSETTQISVTYQAIETETGYISLTINNSNQTANNASYTLFASDIHSDKAFTKIGTVGSESTLELPVGQYQTWLELDVLLEGHGVAYRNGTLYYSTATHIFAIHNLATDLNDHQQISDPITIATLPAGDTSFSLLEPTRNEGLFWHQKHTLKFNSHDQSDQNLYVSIGKPCNTCVIEEEPNYGTVLKVDLNNGEMTQIANGIRNTVGFDWDPTSGDIWFTDNNRQNSDGNAIYYPGEINHINADDIANGTIPHFGFPYLSGVDTPGITPEQFAGTSGTTAFNYLPQGAKFTDLQVSEIDYTLYQDPDLELEAASAALGLMFWETEGIPRVLGQRSMIYTTHGPGDNQRAGYEIRQMTLNPMGKPILDKALITGFKQPSGVIGKPVELLRLPDNSVLVSDDQGNSIYQLKYQPQSETGSVTLLPTSGELNDYQQPIIATLTQPDGVQRRLFLKLDEQDIQLSGLPVGQYNLVIDELAVDGMDNMHPSQSIITFDITHDDEPTSVSWHYQSENNQVAYGDVLIHAPEKPTDGGEFYSNKT
ncbi:hypothetical protein L0B53_12225 [Vibrio sp. SS-MA-C1-2]|uniref:PQQ-dependent sugar dehydrogenase n=1 Tax=Vibrio sp. SS-MA-C1-2 TaxID=2908646 RepID=UPI001F335B76|nr:hypothetical protein [Vibrio sp. SS-MA-C1-2]UJF17793.1 hypothetical protein L0B53_12225 [Vibrio sp. SS-MA-C1-2]